MSRISVQADGPLGLNDIRSYATGRLVRWWASDWCDASRHAANSLVVVVEDSWKKPVEMTFTDGQRAFRTRYMYEMVTIKVLGMKESRVVGHGEQQIVPDSHQTRTKDAYLNTHSDLPTVLRVSHRNIAIVGGLSVFIRKVRFAMMTASQRSIAKLARSNLPPFTRVLCIIRR